MDTPESRAFRIWLFCIGPAGRYLPYERTWEQYVEIAQARNELDHRRASDGP